MVTRSGQPTARTAAADRDDAGERGGLEIVRSRVMARSREVEQRRERRLHGGDLRLRRSSPPHRHDDDVAIPCEQARDMSGDGGLPDALAGSDHRQRRERERRVRRRRELEVGALVAQPGRQDAAREQQPLARPQDRLVRHVHDDLGVRKAVVERLEQRHAVLDVAAQLLRPARKPRADHLVRQLGDRVAHHRRIVLAVDHDQGPRHRREVTSPSIRAVYFSNSSVSIANWMIFSWPWNGYLRHTSTCVPENSITL